MERVLGLLALSALVGCSSDSSGRTDAPVDQVGADNVDSPTDPAAERDAPPADSDGGPVEITPDAGSDMVDLGGETDGLAADGTGDLGCTASVGSAPVGPLYAWTRSWREVTPLPYAPGGTVAVQTDGTAVVGGQFIGAVDFDPGPASDERESKAPGAACFVVRVKVDGGYLDVTTFGGDKGSCSVRGVASRTDGSFLAVGRFDGIVDFESGPGVDERFGGSASSFVSSFSPTGVREWTSTLDLSSAASVAVFSSGELIVAGHFLGSSDFDPGSGVLSRSAAGSSDAYLWRLSTSGSLVWAYTFGGPSTALDEATDVATDAAGAVFASGVFDGGVDFDAGTGSDVHVGVATDGFLLKLDGAGKFVWARHFGGDDGDVARSVASSPSGGVFVGGYFSTAANFNPSGAGGMRSSVGYQDAFVSRWTSDGAYEWTWTKGATAAVAYVFSLAAHSMDDVLIGGFFREAPDFGTSGLTDLRPSNGVDDAMLVLLASPGNNPSWVYTVGCTDADQITGVAAGPGDSTVAAGQFIGTIDFNPGIAADIRTSGVTGLFVSRFSP